LLLERESDLRICAFLEIHRETPVIWLTPKVTDIRIESFLYCSWIHFVVQSESMKTTHRSLAALELLLVSPAVLFMAALFARNVQPQQYEPAHTAQRIVEWYAARPHLGLWILLIALPLAVLTIGLVTLTQEWRRNQDLRNATHQMIALVRAHASALLIASATAVAGGILAIVALHVLTD